jgi:hypothetical protein
MLILISVGKSRKQKIMAERLSRHDQTIRDFLPDIFGIREHFAAKKSLLVLWWHHHQKQDTRYVPVNEGFSACPGGRVANLL